MDYSKYKFNYFDVVKRHERIINRPKDWEIKVLAFIMLFVTFCYVFTSGVFAVEEWEEITATQVENLIAPTNQNYFSSSSGVGVGYFPIENGYIYKITILRDLSGARVILGVSDVPAVNVPYTILQSGLQYVGDSYSFVASGDDYAFLSFYAYANSSYIKIERQKIASMDGAVGDLVNNVGINQIWSVFNNGINFVGVVVLVAFGLFLVVLAIKKVSKGKSEF